MLKPRIAATRPIAFRILAGAHKRLEGETIMTSNAGLARSTSAAFATVLVSVRVSHLLDKTWISLLPKR